MNFHITRLPLEILDTIIDFVELDADNDDDLISCSLTCHAFLPRCRKHLFEVIIINSAALLERFNGLMESSPWLACYVRDLEFISMPVQDFNRCPALGFDRLMKKIHILFIGLQRSDEDGRAPWTQLEPPVQNFLLRLIHLPSLVRLELRGTTGILLSDIAPCANLKVLIMDHNELGEYNHCSLSHYIIPPIVKLKKLCLDSSSARSIAKFLPFAGSPMVFDMDELEIIGFDYDAPMEQSDVRILRCAPQLKTVEFKSNCISSLSNINIAPLLASSDSLRFLTFHIYDDADPLPIVFNKLESIASHELNRIEGLCFSMLILWDSETRAITEPAINWDLFTQHFLRPRESTARQRWRALRQVRLNIYLEEPFGAEVSKVSHYEETFASAMEHMHDARFRTNSGHWLDFDFAYYPSDAVGFHSAIHSL